MTVYFMGGELDAFIPSDSTVTETTATVFNGSFCRAAIYTINTANYAETPTFGALTDFWTHCDLGVAGGGSGVTYYPRVVWVDGSNVERVRLSQSYASGGTIKMEYNIGAGWVIAGSAIAVDISSALQAIDVRTVCNTASGTITLYLGGTERITATGLNLAAITSLNKLRQYGSTNSGIAFGTYGSQYIVADEPTIGWRLMTRYPNGAGSTTDMTGGYIDVDEIVLNDADFLNTSTNNHVELFTQTGSVITGYVVRAVAVSARAKRGASGPQNLRLALRSAGTTYFSSGDKALSLGYSAYQTIWEQDPATTSDWVNTAIDTLQPGVKALA